MPWQIPVTEDQSGQIIANAVQNALMTRYQLGRQQKFDKLALAGQGQEQALRLAEAAGQGIHFLQPGERAPYLGALPTPQSIQQATTNAQPASSKQGPTGLWSPANAPTSGTTSSPFAEMFGDMPRYESGPGFYIDRYERAMPQVLAASLAGLTEYNKTRAQIAADPSAPNERNARAYEALRNANTPRLGDGDVYNNALAGKAAAEYGATREQRIADAIRTNQAESDITEGREGRLLGKRIQAEWSAPQLGRSSATEFNGQNQGLVQTVPLYGQVKTAIDEARKGNPAALKSALLSYAAVADPKAQLRQGVMHEVMQVDPSFQGNAETALDRLTSGTIPKRILDDMDRMVDRVHAMNAGLYEQRRSAYVSRVPISDVFIPRTQDVFTVPGVKSAAPEDPRQQKIDDMIRSGASDADIIRAHGGTP